MSGHGYCNVCTVPPLLFGDIHCNRIYPCLALNSDINAGGSVRCGIRDYSARRCPSLTGRSMINQLYLWDEPAKYLYLYFPSPLYLCLVADIFVKGRKAPAVFIICRSPVNNSGTNPGVNQHWVGKLFRIKERGRERVHE